MLDMLVKIFTNGDSDVDGNIGADIEYRILT